MQTSLKDLILDYIKKHESIHEPSTIQGEFGLFRSISKCLDNICVSTVDELNFDTFGLMVKYYKQFTNRKHNSINKDLSFIKTVLRFNRILDHPFLLTKKLKNDVEHVKPFYEDDLISIFEYFKRLDKSENSYVYRGVAFMLYATGCRVTELLNIKISNIDIRHRQIQLIDTKTKKPRLVYYSKHQDETVRELIDKNKQSTWLFWNNLKDRRLQLEDIRNFNKKASVKLGINIYSRRFRKTMATDLAKKTKGDLKMLQTLLGHTDIKMTQVYVDYSDAQAKSAYDENAHELPVYEKMYGKKNKKAR